AAEAGMLPGDEITAIDGETITEWESVRRIIAEHPGTELKVEVVRDGTPQTLHLTPAANERAQTDDRGNALTGPDGTLEVEQVGMMGVVPTTERVPQPLSHTPAYVGENVDAVVNVVIHLPER